MENIKGKTFLILILTAIITAGILDSGFFIDFWTRVFLFFLLMVWGWITVIVGNKEL